MPWFTWGLGGFAVLVWVAIGGLVLRETRWGTRLYLWRRNRRYRRGQYR
ncbi:uncharacterized protein HemY [Kibdelosporangium banguiense]|uniref:Uncharacterized protein HemY n=1 Tax=Kibdelosporangium banguiense TaxID=1365924 RepID=A0ABS4T5K8_9PSEU|nr:uncharacterized protein HemY [Kibdelosporangium banguiense]